MCRSTCNFGAIREKCLRCHSVTQELGGAVGALGAAISFGADAISLGVDAVGAWSCCRKLGS
ncbi:unnamed protein product [Prunus armeniaca]|uniref:Uncharacterized protein n=1 Tax=Prunus armeniaca TaxID=36596 RepID=A0A6J5X599_PRUAR|nr:unnamed protein product [Prunus armeniaca]